MADAIDGAVLQARKLLRGARSGALATVSDGQPFASLVTPACAPDLSILLWLSRLAEHTRHLRREPRCALLVTGAPDSANPQTTPRLTVAGVAEPIEDAALKARWLAIHPYAALYADFADFGLWRLRIEGAALVAGFARAARLRAADLLPPPGSVAAVAAAEASIIAHCNADHPGAMAAIARAAGGREGAWRLVAVDVDGCDLAQGEEAPVVRADWSGPAETPEEVRQRMVRLARSARAS